MLGFDNLSVWPDSTVCTLCNKVLYYDTTTDFDELLGSHAEGLCSVRAAQRSEKPTVITIPEPAPLHRKAA